MSSSRLIYILLILILASNKSKAASCAEKWPSCGDTINTVCERNKDCSVVAGCKEAHLNEFRKWMVEIHNELRNKLALGEDTRGGNSEASDMNVVSYDTDLEYTAQCHINRCKFSHDKCRATLKFKKFPNVGQNLFSSTGQISKKADAVQAVISWYGEIVDTNEDTIKSFQPHPTKKIGHFTQVVWAKTTHVGCAMSGDGKCMAGN